MNDQIKKAVISVIVYFFCFTVVHGGENLLEGTGFSVKIGWSCYIGKNFKDVGSNYSFKDGKAIIKVGPVKKQISYMVQLKVPVKLDIDKTYKVKVTISSKKAGDLGVYYRLVSKPYTVYASTKITLTADSENEYEVTITPKNSKDKKYAKLPFLAFYLGGIADNTLTFSNISLEAVQ